MSLILDALNRSREDVEKVPGLASQHHDQLEGQGTGWRSYLPWAGLLAALLIIAWLLLDRQQQTPAPSSATVAEMPAPAAVPEPVAPVAQPKAATAAAPQRTIDTAADGPAETDTATDLSRGSETVATEPVVEATSAQNSQGSDSAVAALYQRRGAGGAVELVPQPAAVARPQNRKSPAPAAAAREEQPIDMEKVLRQAREGVEDARLAEHPAPFISQLSQQTKDGIPTIFYERHDYAGSAARSSVVLNGKAMKVGGRPAAGVTVKEILTDSVVLSHRGTEFRLRALNSWVNL